MKERLPKDPLERTSALLSRSLPGTRTLMPAQLPAEVTEILMECRNERAVMYAEAEDLSDRYRTLSEEIDERGVVLHVIDEEDESSLVQHLVDVDRSLGDDDNDEDTPTPARGKIPANRSR